MVEWEGQYWSCAWGVGLNYFSYHCSPLFHSLLIESWCWYQIWSLLLLLTKSVGFHLFQCIAWVHQTEINVSGYIKSWVFILHLTPRLQSLQFTFYSLIKHRFYGKKLVGKIENGTGNGTIYRQWRKEWPTKHLAQLSYRISGLIMRGLRNG